jgi:hypothetical protein
MMAGNDILRAAHGAGRLALRDPGGMAYFDLSYEGFWRSFAIYGLVLPAYLFLAAARIEGGGQDLGALMLAKTLSFAASVVAFPLAMIAVSRAFNLRAHYVPFIVAYNWSQIIVVALAVLIAALGNLLPLGRTIELTLSILLLLWSLYFLWFIARVALQASGQLAAAITALEFALSLAVQSAVESVF